MAAKILVIGSVNMDLVARGDHIPAPGENVRGTDLVEAVRTANAAGALACLALGAQPSMPTAARLAAFLESHG